jgi:hypothetical protein
MSQLITLGGLHKFTHKYVSPKMASKEDSYICPDCSRDLTLCQGEIRIPYFRHKTDELKPCNYYDRPSESQIHKDAKLRLKMLLENNVRLSFIRTCMRCKEAEELGLEYPDTSTTCVELEYRFSYKGTLKIADVAYLDNKECVWIFEICHTHKTHNEDRPEPWFEIDAEQLIQNTDQVTDHLSISCMRTTKCDSCLDAEEKARVKVVTAKTFDDDDDKAAYSLLKSSIKTAKSNRVENNVEMLRRCKVAFTSGGTNMVVITHPHTGTTIRHSLAHNKILYKGKWYCGVRTSLLINWYDAKCDFVIENAIRED